jgi:hypothetical protein
MIQDCIELHTNDKIFRKLRTATHLKARSDTVDTTVGFAGRIARTAHFISKA